MGETKKIFGISFNSFRFFLFVFAYSLTIYVVLSSPSNSILLKNVTTLVLEIELKVTDTWSPIEKTP